jgi:hypothetical protein
MSASGLFFSNMKSSSVITITAAIAFGATTIEFWRWKHEQQ